MLIKSFSSNIVEHILLFFLPTFINATKYYLISCRKVKFSLHNFNDDIRLFHFFSSVTSKHISLLFELYLFFRVISQISEVESSLLNWFYYTRQWYEFLKEGHDNIYCLSYEDMKDVIIFSLYLFFSILKFNT